MGIASNVPVVVLSATNESRGCMGTRTSGAHGAAVSPTWRSDAPGRCSGSRWPAPGRGKDADQGARGHERVRRQAIRPAPLRRFPHSCDKSTTTDRSPATRRWKLPARRRQRTGQLVDQAVERQVSGRRNTRFASGPAPGVSGVVSLPTARVELAGLPRGHDESRLLVDDGPGNCQHAPGPSATTGASGAQRCGPEAADGG